MSEEAPQFHQTAGGVVVNAAGELLVIVRDIERDGVLRHEVRLPKGHIDPGETAEAAAVREVAEETGYADVALLADLGTARSEYLLNGRPHVREEFYWLMRLRSETAAPPQHMNAEEALFVNQWLSPEEAAAQVTYPSEREFVRRAIAALQASN